MTDGFAICSDSVPVGVPQNTGRPGSLHVRLENRKIYAIEIVCCGRRVSKKET